MDYLAVPYSHPDPEVCEYRAHMADRIAAKLLQQGRMVFSPISHSHPISQHMGNSLDGDFWILFDAEFLAQADTLIVAQLLGWDESKGIQKEISMAKIFGVTVEYLDPYALLEITL